MERTFCFFENEHICSTTKYTDRFPLIFNTGDFNDSFS